MLAFYLENFRLGLRNLFLHRLRSFLTALGIIFGVLAVIVMVALGQGGKEAARKQVEQLGATNVLTERSRRPLSRQAASAAAEHFASRAEGGRTIERFDLLHFAAWAPAAVNG